MSVRGGMQKEKNTAVEMQLFWETIFSVQKNKWSISITSKTHFAIFSVLGVVWKSFSNKQIKKAIIGYIKLCKFKDTEVRGTALIKVTFSVSFCKKLLSILE